MLNVRLLRPDMTFIFGDSSAVDYRLIVNTFTIMLMFMQYVYIQWTLRIAVHALTSGAVCKSLFLSKVVSLYNSRGVGRNLRKGGLSCSRQKLLGAERRKFR